MDAHRPLIDTSAVYNHQGTLHGFRAPRQNIDRTARSLGGNFECQEDIHFKTQSGPVAKNATPRPPAGN